MGINLCKSHVTALKKIRSALSEGCVVSMGGCAINIVLTKDDYKKIAEARPHIDKAIEILSKCKQLR